MKQRPIVALLICALLFVLFGCSSKQGADRKIIVKVNDEYIYHDEIATVYEQIEGTNITFDKIVDDTITEILVIQQAPLYGIGMTKEEIEKTVEDYKQQYPDYYNETIKKYDRDEFEKRIADKGLYIKVREHFLHTYEVTDADVEDFIRINNLVEQLSPYDNTQIRTYFEKELSNFVFIRWAKELREGAAIEYFD